MRTMIRRLQRLEDRTSMQRNEWGETPVEVLREFPVRVRNSEKIALCDPVMPVTHSFRC